MVLILNVIQIIIITELSNLRQQPPCTELLAILDITCFKKIQIR
jgi:hypothetical protein